MKRWKLDNRIPDDNIAHQGYTFRNPAGIEMVKFFLDNYDFLHSLADKMGFGLLGGNLSICKPQHQKPLMIFGQDESVFNQFLLKPKQWVAPQGQRAILPKTEGMSLMLSAFQSRESGFGEKVSYIQLEEINEVRRGQNYVDLNAALAVYGQVAKKDLLEESTFVVSFELGANNEGYWPYNHMSIQFEDCVNCIKVVYPAHFNFAVFVRSFTGTCKKLAGGLDAYSMGKSYRGAHPMMREAKIKDHDGYLCMHDCTLHVGDA